MTDRTDQKMPPAATQPRAEECLTAVGGCNGIYLLPAEDLADYYRAHSLITCGAIALLPLVMLAGLVS